MIYSLTGELKLKGDKHVNVAVGGFEFQVSMPVSSVAKLPKLGAKVHLFTFLHVREGGLDLYGFLAKGELEFFEALISVSGIGPKSALAILSVAPIDQLMAAISKGEAELLQTSSGVGKKTAERIVLELKDKVIVSGDEKTVELMKSDDDVYGALVGLGYQSRQAKEVLQKIDPKLTNASDRLKDALKKIKG